MRWASWLLGIAGIVQYALIVYLSPSDYVSTDMAYLVMFLCVIAALFLCYVSCWGCGYGDDGCECCGDDCQCGDCECCVPEGGRGHEHGHEGHTH